MKSKFFSLVFAASALVFASNAHAAEHDINACLKAWGSSAPFKKGQEPDKIISTGVKVFGVGKTIGDSEKTEKPSLVFVKPAVNVLGKSVLRLENPNGWYCFKSNVSVLGKIEIAVDCKAHVATAGEADGGGASVLGADDSDSGVTVLGSLRITRLNCADEKGKKE